MSIFFPKKKGERHALSKQNAMKMLPYRVMTVAVQRKHIPVGSNEKKGRKSLDSAVKTGEKRRIGNVFFPMRRCVVMHDAPLFCSSLYKSVHFL